MLDFKTQSQLVDATATIMRSYLRAATTTFAASASRSMSLWTEMLEAASPRHAPAAQPQPAARPLIPTPWSPMVQKWWLGPSVTFWAPLADWSMWSRAPFPAWGGWLPQVLPPSERATPNGAAQRAADDGGFASYRSAGGHASTQVIIGS
jgi:hypothetical protein